MFRKKHKYFISYNVKEETPPYGWSLKFSNSIIETTKTKEEIVKDFQNSNKLLLCVTKLS